jgi:hypothetical protein
MRCDIKSCDVTFKPDTPRDLRTGCSHVEIYQGDQLVEAAEKAKQDFDRICRDEEGGASECSPKYYINLANTRDNMISYLAKHRCGNGVYVRVALREDIIQ